MKLAELPELNQRVKDLTSIFLRGSDQPDEPPLGLWAHLLSKLDQHQGFDVLRYAAGAPDFGPTLTGRSSAGFGEDHLLLPLWVPFIAAVCTSSITSWLTHGWTGGCNADPLRHDLWGTFYTLHTFPSIVHGAVSGKDVLWLDRNLNRRFQFPCRFVTSARTSSAR